MLKLKLSLLSAISTLLKAISIRIEGHSVKVEKAAADLMIKKSAELLEKLHKAEVKL